MTDYKIFSADSHVSEPGDLWVERIDKEFKFRAPRVEKRERNGRMEDVFLYEGFPPHPVGVGLGAAAKSGPGNSSFRDEGKGYADALPGGWDPATRIKDMDIDGVEGEILHTTLGFRLFWVQDPKLQRALFRVYNDWLAEFCSHAPDRLIGVPLISLYDIDEARTELRRCANLGLRGAMIWLAPPAGYPEYTSQLYDPFWAECQDLGMPLVLHEITGGAESRLSPSSYWDPMGCDGSPHDPNDETIVAVGPSRYEEWPCGQNFIICGAAGCIAGVRQDSCPGCGDTHLDLSRAGLETVCEIGLHLCSATFLPLN